MHCVMGEQPFNFQLTHCVCWSVNYFCFYWFIGPTVHITQWTVLQQCWQQFLAPATTTYLQLYLCFCGHLPQDSSHQVSSRPFTSCVGDLVVQIVSVILIYVILHRNHKFCALFLWKASCLGKHSGTGACESLTPFKQSGRSLLWWSTIDIGICMKRSQRHMGGQ